MGLMCKYADVGMCKLDNVQMRKCADGVNVQMRKCADEVCENMQMWECANWIMCR